MLEKFVKNHIVLIPQLAFSYSFCPKDPPMQLFDSFFLYQLKKFFFYGKLMISLRVTTAACTIELKIWLPCIFHKDHQAVCASDTLKNIKHFTVFGNLVA